MRFMFSLDLDCLLAGTRNNEMGFNSFDVLEYFEKAYAVDYTAGAINTDDYSQASISISSKLIAGSARPPDILSIREICRSQDASAPMAAKSSSST
jgi:hypothetical protein